MKEIEENMFEGNESVEEDEQKERLKNIEYLDEIRSITDSNEALVAMEYVAEHFNIAFDDALGCWANRSGKTVDDCDNYESMDEEGCLVFGWDNDNEDADHAMDLIRYIDANSYGDEVNW